MAAHLDRRINCRMSNRWWTPTPRKWNITSTTTSNQKNAPALVPTPQIMFPHRQQLNRYPANLHIPSSSADTTSDNLFIVSTNQWTWTEHNGPRSIKQRSFSRILYPQTPHRSHPQSFWWRNGERRHWRTRMSHQARSRLNSWLHFHIISSADRWTPGHNFIPPYGKRGSPSCSIPHPINTQLLRHKDFSVLYPIPSRQ